MHQSLDNDPTISPPAASSPRSWLGAIMMPFIKCGQAIGCVSEDFGKTKVMVNDEGRECVYSVSTECEEDGLPLEREVQGRSIASSSGSRKAK